MACRTEDLKLQRQTLFREMLREIREAGRHSLTTSDGLKLVVYPDVYSPTMIGEPAFYAEALPVPRGGTVLEIGCGAGLIALAAAKKGATKVLATDISPAAVANCKVNAASCGLAEIVTARVSDVFSAVAADERFDVIFWNFPSVDASRDEYDPLECAVFDPEYRIIARYLRGARAHLSPGGHALLGFSDTVGNRALLDQRAAEAGAALSVYQTREYSARVLAILEITYP
jgi:release factor glutamine methyltransferase